MKRRFDEQLKKLKDKLFKMGLLVEEAIQKSGNALAECDAKLAQEVIEKDAKINILEIEIDEMGHELIALMQPTAIDLRVITMVLKINSDLERIGDQAVNIAQKAQYLSRSSPLKVKFNLPKMVRLAVEMLRDALDAFSNRDAEKAKSICERDDEMDDLNRGIYKTLLTSVEEKKIDFPNATCVNMIAHNLERIADLTTNIAEDVIYIAKGIDIRHHITERREE
jgi:phosphate transport system protein